MIQEKTTSNKDLLSWGKNEMLAIATDETVIFCSQNKEDLIIRFYPIKLLQFNPSGDKIAIGNIDEIATYAVKREKKIKTRKLFGNYNKDYNIVALHWLSDNKLAIIEYSAILYKLAIKLFLCTDETIQQTETINIDIPSHIINIREIQYSPSENYLACKTTHSTKKQYIQILHIQKRCFLGNSFAIPSYVKHSSTREHERSPILQTPGESHFTFIPNEDILIKTYNLHFTKNAIIKFIAIERSKTRILKKFQIKGKINSIAIHPHKTDIAAPYKDHIRIIDTQTSNVKQILKRKNIKKSTTTTLYNKTGTHLASLEEDNDLVIWKNARNKNLLQTINKTRKKKLYLDMVIVAQT